MKTLLLIILLLASSPSWAAFTLVASEQQTGTLNTVTTDAINTTGANLIIIAAGGWSTKTISDSKSNTWTKLTTYSNATPFIDLAFYYAYNPTVGTNHTFTNANTSGAPSISVLAFSGSNSSPFDKENGATFNTTTSVSTGSITPAENNELVVTALAGGSTTGSWSVASGYTNVGYLNLVPGNSCGTGIAYAVQTTATATNPSWTGTSGSGTVAIASFKAAPDAGGALFILGDDF